MGDDDYTSISDFKLTLPKALIDMGKCSCGNIVHGRIDNGVNRYFRTSTGRDITICDECYQKAHPPTSNEQWEKVSRRAAKEDRLRKEYSIPCHRGVREWLIEFHGKKVTVNDETIVVVNEYARGF